MIAVATTGPYEHRGAYQESELFDTSGVSLRFCPSCEHDPCVAGAVQYCENHPRFTVAASIVREIRRAALPPSPWRLPAVLAVSNLLHVAADGSSFRGEIAMAALADIRAEIRKSLQAAMDES